MEGLRDGLGYLEAGFFWFDGDTEDIGAELACLEAKRVCLDGTPLLIEPVPPSSPLLPSPLPLRGLETDLSGLPANLGLLGLFEELLVRLCSRCGGGDCVGGVVVVEDPEEVSDNVLWRCCMFEGEDLRLRGGDSMEGGRES